MCMALLVVPSACTILTGGRFSAGPSIDTDGDIGLSIGLNLSWGMSGDRGTPMVDDKAIMETVTMGTTLSEGHSSMNTSVAFEYARVPLRLGLGVGLRFPFPDSDTPDEEDDVKIGDILTAEFYSARLWVLSEKRRRLTTGGVELRCGYFFLGGRAICSLSPSIGVAGYRRYNLPH